MTITRATIAAPDAPQITSGYAQAVSIKGAAELLFISGQIPVTVQGDVPKDFTTQARLVWANIFAQLQAAGMAKEHLTKVTIFLSDRIYIPENRDVRLKVLGGHEVALTVIIAGIFDEGWLLEIEAIAAK
jgi:2-iminobutanoate/2-iminopropanoate deaminase